MTITDQIFDLFSTKGDAAYVGDRISQTEHALQSAAQAEKEGAPDSLVVAALLHDIGHLLHNLPGYPAEHGIDDRHEASGRAWLAKWFGSEISEPVRLHVAAKRYLCYAEPQYLRQLSEGSIRSLNLQGGPFSASEAQAFEQNAYWRDACRLRRWDDGAKVFGLAVPGLEHYRARIEAAAKTDA